MRDGAGKGSPAFVLPNRIVLPDPLGDLSRLVFRYADLLVSAVDSFEAACPGNAEVSSEVRSKAAAQLALSTTKVASALMRASIASGMFVEADMKVEPGQPFRLDLIAKVSSWTGDPDAAFPLRVKGGLTLGSEVPIDDSGLWPLKGAEEDSFRDVAPEYVVWDKNYRSFDEFKEKAMAKIQTDLDMGFARGGIPWNEACAQLLEPDEEPPPEPRLWGEGGGPPSDVAAGFAAAKLGAVPQGDSVRVVVDETVDGVNRSTPLPETMQTPGLQELQGGMAAGLPLWKALKVDVKSAFKRIKLIKADWRRALFCVDGLWYFYVTLPFGARASAYWWVRFYAVIHRVLHWVLIKFPHGGLMYIDDSLWLFEASIASRCSAAVLLVLALFGVPLSWDKTQVGSQVDWVGFAVDLEQRKVQVGAAKLGISKISLH